MHPSDILFQDENKPLAIPVCDHYAGSEKLMRKSMTLQHELGPVFDITFDCEDGAAAGDEEAHARLIASLIDCDNNRFDRIGVRVHDAASVFFETDVRLICSLAAQRLAYMVIPKVSGLAQLLDAIEVVNRHAIAAGRSNLPIHVLVETHGALGDVHQIAALPQVECISFGIMDFVSAHFGAIPDSAMRSPGQFEHRLIVRAKLEIAAACHAHGKVPSHNVTTEIADLSVVASDSQRAMREFGYTRMWSIHPAQIKPIVRAFTPASEDIDKAADILSAAKNAQWGPIRFDGELHDRASYRYYWTLLQRARLGGQPLPESATALQ